MLSVDVMQPLRFCIAKSGLINPRVHVSCHAFQIVQAYPLDGAADRIDSRVRGAAIAGTRPPAQVGAIVCSLVLPNHFAAWPYALQARGRLPYTSSDKGRELQSHYKSYQGRRLIQSYILP